MAGCAAILGLSSAQIFAIEGLTIKIQNGTNVVLGWPSVPNETYIIQSTPALNSSNGWQTLTNFYPAAPGTNWTTYVISNAISLSSGGGSGTNGGSGGEGPPSPGVVVAGSTTAPSDTSSLSAEIGPDDIMLPPSPWLPETLPGGAILKANGTYVPLSSPQSGGTVSPDGGTPQPPPDPGFYLVVRDGVHCVGLSNNMVVSGMVTIPLEIAVPTNDYITGAVLSVDGAMTPGGAATLGPSNLWTFYWDTTAVPNGTHQLSAAVIFSEDSADVEVTNALTVTVSNLLSFPYYYSQVFGQGLQMWVNAQSAVSNVNWQVWVYNSQTNYLGYFSNYSANGSISFTWDLQSANLTDPTFRLDYYLFAAATGKSLTAAGKPAASKWQIGEAPWTPSGMVVACAPVDNSQQDTANVNDMVLDGVVNICWDRLPGGLWPSANTQFGNAWTWGSNGGKADLLAVIPTCNFLYYFGHGTKYSFGRNLSDHIYYGDLLKVLHNFPTNGGLTNLVATNSHPYKLVFIDDCATGGGPMCEAFGIPAGQFSTNFFLLAGVRARAYVGYTKPVTYNVVDWVPRATMLASFWNSWWGGSQSIYTIVTNCESTATFSEPMDKSAVIYGANNMNASTF
jgi:hypothetical protein